MATVDARLFAPDATTGQPCRTFGTNGVITLTRGLRTSPAFAEEFEVTSPPEVVNGLIVSVSAIADKNRTNAASGEVRTFDARTGALRWTWDPVPRDPTDAAWNSWRGVMSHTTGAANAWSVIAADSTRDMMFVPTGSASPDCYGGERLGDQYTRMHGTPFMLRRRLIPSPSRAPCSPPPWGALVAINLETGARAWEAPLGDPAAMVPGLAGVSKMPLGLPNLGGPIATAGGVVFIGAAMDPVLRAFDADDVSGDARRQAVRGGVCRRRRRVGARGLRGGVRAAIDAGEIGHSVSSRWIGAVQARCAAVSCCRDRRG